MKHLQIIVIALSTAFHNLEKSGGQRLALERPRYLQQVADDLSKAHSVERTGQGVGEREHHADRPAHLRSQRPRDHEVRST